MDGTRDYQTKSKKKKERQISYGITYIWNLKYDTSKAICEILPMKQKQIHRHRDQTCVSQGRKWGRGRLGVWGQQTQTNTYRMDKQQNPTMYTYNYIQYPEINQNGKEYKK